MTNYESTAGGMDAGAPAGQGPWRRVRYFFQEPAVRLAVYASLDQASNRIAAVMVESRGMPQTKARVAAHAFVFGYFAALEQWYLDGGVHPIADYVDDGMSVLRDIWSQPEGQCPGGCTPHVLSDAKGGAVTAVAHRVLG